MSVFYIILTVLVKNLWWLIGENLHKDVFASTDLPDRQLEALNLFQSHFRLAHFYEIISSLKIMKILLNFPVLGTVADSVSHGLFTIL